MATLYLAHVTVYDPSLPGEKTLRFCTGTGFVTGTDSAKRPAGVAAHVAYEPRIIQPAYLRRDAFSPGATSGASSLGGGELILVNADGALDGLLDYGLDGRSIEIILGRMEPYQNPVFTTVLKGAMEQARVSLTQVAIRVRDRQAELDKPVQTTKYAGSNSLPNGLEGVAGDLQGKPKPRLYGQVFNCAPPLVNTSRLIYQVNDGAVQSIDAVYDRGAVLGAGAAYTSQTDMETNAPTAGTYRAWLAGGYIRLGSTPAGLITVDATQGAAAGNRTAAQILKAIATGPGGIASGDVSSSDVTALDTATTAVVGIWIGEEMTCRAALDAVAESVGAWWGFDRLGVFRMQRVDSPLLATPTVYLTNNEILSIERVPTGDTGSGVTVWRVKLSYKRFWQTQESDLAGSVTAARRAELAENWRGVVSEDTDVKTAHRLAGESEFSTLLTVAGDATSEAARRLALFKVRRDRLELRVALDTALAANIDLGTCVQITLNRFGYGAGKKFVVLGIQPDLRTGVLNLTLWG